LLLSEGHRVKGSKEKGIGKGNNQGEGIKVIKRKGRRKNGSGGEGFANGGANRGED
jgi:hypothetical protein